MTGMLCRNLLALVCIAGPFCWSAATPQAGEKPDKSKLRIRAGFSETYQVGFTLLDKDGKPQRITFDDKGGTNVVIVRIDGKDIAFGFEGGIFKSKNVPLDRDRVGVAVTWAIDKVEITQTVETDKSQTGEWDTCLVSYTIHNKDDKAHMIGVRVMLDTHLGASSKQYFNVGDSKDIISTKADWKDKEVPAVLRTMQKASLSEPGLHAIFSLRAADDFEAPGRVVLTQFPERDIAFGWDLPVKDIGNDAVVGFFWTAQELKAGAMRKVGYGYGAGIVESAVKKQP
jgi:hypothetical protein